MGWASEAHFTAQSTVPFHHQPKRKGSTHPGIPIIIVLDACRRRRRRRAPGWRNSKARRHGLTSSQSSSSWCSSASLRVPTEPSFLPFAARGALQRGNTAFPRRHRCLGSCCQAATSSVSQDCMPQENDMPGPWSYNKDACKISVLSLVVCSTRLIAAIVAVGDLGTIALCRPGASAWSVSSDEDCRWLSHLIFFQGKLYALDSNTDPEDLIAIHIVDDHGCNEPRVSRIERLIQGASLPHQKYSFCQGYLLESHGTLLMIRRKLSYKSEYPSERRYGGTLVAGSSEFVVFEADFEEGFWSEVRTLGNDQALFLGRVCSRAVCVSPYDLSRDCLFFIDDYTDWSWKKTTTSCGVYDMKDEKVYPSLPTVSWKSGDVPATWLFSEGKTDKLQAAGEHLQEVVEAEEEDPQCGGACAGGASTA